MILYPDTYLSYLSGYYNPTSLLPISSVQGCPQQTPTPPPVPAPAWPIFTQWQGSHTVRGDRRGVGRGWLTAVPERMLRDDGWPSRYVMS